MGKKIAALLPVVLKNKTKSRSGAVRGRAYAPCRLKK